MDAYLPDPSWVLEETDFNKWPRKAQATADMHEEGATRLLGMDDFLSIQREALAQGVVIFIEPFYGGGKLYVEIDPDASDDRVRGFRSDVLLERVKNVVDELNALLSGVSAHSKEHVEVSEPRWIPVAPKKIKAQSTMSISAETYRVMKEDSSLNFEGVGIDADQRGVSIQFLPPLSAGKEAGELRITMQSKSIHPKDIDALPGADQLHNVKAIVDRVNEILRVIQERVKAALPPARHSGGTPVRR